MNAQLEKVFYHFIDTRPELEQTMDLQFYENPDIRLAHKIREEFRKKFSRVPTKSQLKEIVKLKSLTETLDADKIDALYDIKLDQYDQDWLEDNVETWIEYKTLETSVQDLVSYMKTTKVTPENVKEFVNTAKSMITERNNIDFNFDDGSDFQDPEKHKQKIHERFSTGFKFFDQVLKGGYAKKSLICFAGAAKVGKSICLANLATQSIAMGYNCAYVSLEMSEQLVMKRVSQNLFNVNGDEYDENSDSEDWVKKKLKNLYGIDSFTTPGNFRVKEFPTSTASVIDIENWLKRSMEKNGFKYEVVFIDYIAIVKNWRNPNSENLYLKIKNIAEDLRAMASRLNICVVTATQINKGAFNMTDMSMGDVAESSGLIHTVDALFGIIQDEIMYTDKRYYFKVLANRINGMKNCKKSFNISYDYMRLSEDVNEDIIMTDL